LAIPQYVLQGGTYTIPIIALTLIINYTVLPMLQLQEVNT